MKIPGANPPKIVTRHKYNIIFRTEIKRHFVRFCFLTHLLVDLIINTIIQPTVDDFIVVNNLCILCLDTE